MVRVYVVVEELGNHAKMLQKELFGTVISLMRATKKKEKDELLQKMFDLCGGLGGDLNAAFENVKELE